MNTTVSVAAGALVREAPIRALRAAAYRIPTDKPEADGTLSWDATTLVVVGGGGARLSGSALRMGADDVSLAMSKLPVFRSLLLRYVQLVLVQTSQLAACNAAHPLKQRLARWILAAQD